jgi:hypothetical protein
MASRKPLVIVAPQIEQIQTGDTLGVRSSADGTTSGPTTTSATFVVIPEMTLTVTTTGGQLLTLFDGDFNIQGGDDFLIAVFLDGSEVAGTRRELALTFTLTLGVLTLSSDQTASNHVLLAASTGSHTVDVRWQRTAGTARANGTQRKLTLIEMF